MRVDARTLREGTMSNVLSDEKRLAVLAALCDGNSIRAVERMTGVHRDTIMRFGLTLGEGAIRLHNRMARELSCSLVQCDGIWSYVQKKQARHGKGWSRRRRSVHVRRVGFIIAIRDWLVRRQT